MESQLRRHRTIQDQENMNITRKPGVTIPTKHMGLNIRGPLGELDTNTNVQNQANVNVSKIAVASDIEKKAASRRIVRSYRHVQSKVDTGRGMRDVIQPSSRPPLRREESTGILAARAIVTKAVLKDAQKKPADPKIPVNITSQVHKLVQDKKNLLAVKENIKEVKCCVVKPNMRESFGKLKLDDNNATTKKGAEVLQKPIRNTSQLPEGIEDIDAADTNTALQSTRYIKHIYKYLSQLEKKYAIVKDHMAKQEVVSARMRAVLLDWLVDVHVQFSLELETFQITVGIIDRYLQIVPDIKKSELQLVGITAMLIASKYEEIYSPGIESFIDVTDRAYSKSAVKKCEQEICFRLGFCLAWPIPLTFLRRFFKAARGSSQNHHLAKYFVDLCLLEYSMAHYRPSELAAAAVCLSLYLLSSEEMTQIWTPTLCYYSEYTLSHIEPIVQKMATIVINVENSKFKATYNRYSQVIYAKVSTLPQLKGQRIRQLCNTV